MCRDVAHIVSEYVGLDDDAKNFYLDKMINNFDRRFPEDVFFTPLRHYNLRNRRRLAKIYSDAIDERDKFKGKLSRLTKKNSIDDQDYISKREAFKDFINYINIFIAKCSDIFETPLQPNWHCILFI